MPWTARATGLLGTNTDRGRTTNAKPLPVLRKISRKR